MPITGSETHTHRHMKKKRRESQTIPNKIAEKLFYPQNKSLNTWKGSAILLIRKRRKHNKSQ